MVRGQGGPRRAYLQEQFPRCALTEGDLLDQSSLQRAILASRPDVVFNLGAVTFVGMSWQQPSVMSEVTGLGCLRLLEAVRAVGPAIRVVQASSSEMFGRAPSPQDEGTPLRPVSPYGVAKTFAHHCAVTYRESHGLHASAAVMFNHESPRRGTEFVTRKVTRAAAAIARGRQRSLVLGRLRPRRDWGAAADYVKALRLIALQDDPGDYVVATGESRTVEELCAVAFAAAGLDWREHVTTDPSLFRPAEIWELRGNASKARDVLGWKPETSFTDMIGEMVRCDLEALG
jgi:GDPmannose 4,6-dehydratase